MDVNEFANPSNKYRGVTLWMLNDKLETDELKRQLKEIHDKGIGAVIGRTFIGLRTAYLSDEFIQRLQTIVDLAEELDMKVFFQAGFMPSGIPDQEPGSAQTGLASIPKGEEGQDAKVLCEDDKHVYVETQNEYVLDMFNSEAVDKYLKAAYEDTWFSNFKEQFGKTISSIWVDEPHFYPPYIPWGNILQTEFEKEWGYKVEEHIPSLFLERGNFMKVRHHYWRTVTRLLLNGYFEQTSKWCERHGVSFSGHLMGEDTLAAQITFTGACMPMYEKMQLPGIDHLTMSLNWSHWNKSKEGERWRFIMTPKQCSSAANQFGKKEVLAEMYAVSTQGITFEDRKQIADWFFIHGVNFPCLHGTFYSMRGRRKRIHIPHLSFQQPWWKHNKLIADYSSRISYVLQQGSFCADLLVLHPIESAYTKFAIPEGKDFDPSAFSKELEELNDSFAGLSERLMKIHRGFEYGDEHIMAEQGSVENGEIKVGKMRYKTIILPDTITLRSSTAKLLEKFIEEGGSVFAAGSLPTQLDGIESNKAKELAKRFTKVENDEQTLARAIEKVCPPRVSIKSNNADASNVFIHEREMEDGTVTLFCFNTSEEEQVSLTLSLELNAAGYELNCSDGSRVKLGSSLDGKVELCLDFEPLQSRLLQFDTNEVAAKVETAKAQPRAIAELSRWQLNRKSPNAMTLDYCRLRKGGGDFGEVIPLSAVQQLLQEEAYEGAVTLQCEFAVESLPGFMAVVIEDADQAQISINGNSVKYEGMDYYRDPSFLPVDISRHIKLGKNVLEVSFDFRQLKEPQEGLSRFFAHVEGTELEYMYLIGDFAVFGSKSDKKPLVEHLRYSPGFLISEERESSGGDLLADGYPFFVGDMELSADFTIDSVSEGRLWLDLPGLESCVAEIFVNGKKLDSIAWKPYKAEISGAVKAGKNSVRISLTNTLRNLLGPHHRPQIERQQNWGFNDFIGYRSEISENIYPDWITERSPDTDAWMEDYSFVRFGIYDTVKVIAEG